MSSSDNLLSRWNSILALGGNSYTRVDAVHPLDFYIGYEGISQKTLLLVSNHHPQSVSSSRSVMATIGQRADDNWAFLLRLVQPEQDSVFVRLCDDLIESSRGQSNDACGLRFVIDRYRQWHRLLERQVSGLLTEIQIRGLLGELLFLLGVLSQGLPALEAVSGWLGPEGADRDFTYGRVWYEVKSVSTGTKTVSISSLEQLDAPPPGELVVFFMDKAAPQDQSGFSLRGKVEEARRILQHNPVASDAFNSKLLKVGYIDLKEYSEHYYRVSGSHRYALDAHFPRFTRSSVHPAIVGVKYEISHAAMAPWRVK